MSEINPPRLNRSELLRRARQLCDLSSLIEREASDGNLHLATDMLVQAENEGAKLIHFGDLNWLSLRDELRTLAAASPEPPASASGDTAANTIPEAVPALHPHTEADTQEHSSGNTAISTDTAPPPVLAANNTSTPAATTTTTTAAETPTFDNAGYPITALHTFGIPGLARTSTPGVYTATSYRGKKFLRYHLKQQKFKLRMSRKGELAEEERTGKRRRCSRCASWKVQGEMREGWRECLKCWGRRGRREVTGK